MNGAGVLMLLSAVLQPGLAGYALRLNRVFGTRRVGWWLVAAFLCLGLLHLMHSLPRAGVSNGTIDVLISLLLLVGMAHTEAFYASRLRLEHKDRKAQAELERVTRQSQELSSANENLLRQLLRREQREKCLSASEKQLQLIFLENPLPMWIFDLRSLRLLAANQAALRQYGFTAGELMALTAQQLHGSRDIPLFLEACAQPNSGTHSSQWQHCGRNGALLDVEVQSLDLLYEDCPARLMVARDVTRQHELDSQLRQQAAAQAARQIAGKVAHHVNRLLAPLRDSSPPLGQKSPAPDAAAQGQSLSLTINCAAAFTRKLLAFSCVQAPQPEPLDLAAFLDNLARTIRFLAGERIVIQKAFGAELPRMLADPAMLHQLVLNLVLNARDAMPGGGTLTLGASAISIPAHHSHPSPEARPGDFVCLSVRDTGCGMDSEVRSHLFEPFYSTRESFNAAGMGLAAVSAIAHQLSGWIEVATQPGAGSEFKVFFPRV
jgi:two-component system, cell cycle sensor histidine kinase and response regulator CckA